jgi:hypothetical protein
MKYGGLAELFDANGSVEVEPNAAAIGFYEKLAEGIAEVVTQGFVVAVCIPEAFGTALETKGESAGIFACDERVEAAQLGRAIYDLTGEVAKRVDKVDARFVHEKTRHGAEVGLAGEVGLFAPAVAHAGAHCERVKFVTDDARLQELFDFAVPGLEAKVLVNHEGGRGTGGKSQDLLGRGEVCGEGLLADDGQAERDGVLYEFEASRGRGGDVDEIDCFVVECFEGVGRDVWDVVFAGSQTGFGFVEIADANDLGTFEALPGVEMEVTEVACANQQAASGFHEIRFYRKGLWPFMENSQISSTIEWMLQRSGG